MVYRGIVHLLNPTSDEYAFCEYSIRGDDDCYIFSDVIRENNDDGKVTCGDCLEYARVLAAYFKKHSF